MVTKIGPSTKGLVVENPDVTRGFELEKLNQAIRNVEMMLEHRRQVPREPSDEMYYVLVAKHLTQYRDAKMSGIPVVAGGGRCVLDAMGLAGYSSTPVAVTIAQTQGLQQDVLNAATEAGLRPFLCSAVGRYAWGGVVRGWMLPPDLMINNSIFCNTQSICSEFWAHWLGVPSFRLDRPFKPSEEAVQYYVKQLEEMIHWLEEQTGHKMDWDKLEENVEYLRQFQELRREIADLRKTIPHPMRSRHCSHLEIMEMYWAGRPEGIAYYTQVRNEIKARVDKGVGFLDNERLRLMCLYLPPPHALSILDWWEREWGAVSVMEPWFTYTPRQAELDPKKPLESLARHAFWGRLCSYMGADGQYILEDVVRIAKEWSAEGAVYYAPCTCNETNTLIQSIKDVLKKKAGIPTLVVDVDYVDPSYVSQEDMRQKTEPFFEMLTERKGV